MDERREHRRLPIRLPIEFGPAEGPRDTTFRAITANISTGGLYFEVELVDGTCPPAPHSVVDVDLTVPAGEGHFPYDGRIRSSAEVLRCETLEANGSSSITHHRRVGVAARFCEPLQLAFP